MRQASDGLKNNWGQSKIHVKTNRHKKCDSDPNYSWLGWYFQANPNDFLVG